MKLQTAYWKNADGSIKVTIKVVDKGDFPTVNIFGSSSGYPAEEGWSLEESSGDYISNTLPNPDEAKQWASSQVNALKEKLDNWRNIWVPEPEGIRSKISIYTALVCCLTVLSVASIILSHRVLYLKNRVSSLEQEVASLMEAKRARLCTVTAYSPTKSQCDDTPWVTASGTRPKVGTVAVSRDLFYSGWVFGSKIYIEGLGIYRINDLMHPRWENRIDVFLESERLARRFGRRKARAVLLKGANNLFAKR